MNKPNQEIKTEPKDRACRTLRRSAKKGLALLLVAVFLVTTAVSGSFTGDGCGDLHHEGEVDVGDVEEQ